jgi:hypothetical protein
MELCRDWKNLCRIYEMRMESGNGKIVVRESPSWLN